MALKDERNPKYVFPRAGTSLLKSPRKSLLYVYVSRCWLLGAAAAVAAAAAAAGAADPSKRRFPCCCCAVPTKTRYTFLAAGSLQAAALLPLRLLMRLLVSAAAYDACCCLAGCCCLLPAAACCSLLLCPQRHGPPGRGNTMALKDERSPKYAFPGAGTSLLKSPRKSLLYTFLGFSMLATGSCCCCCSCAHKDTALPDGETPWPWRTNGVQNKRFPGPERLFSNFLEKACYIRFLVSRCWQNTMALKDERSPK